MKTTIAVKTTATISHFTLKMGIVVRDWKSVSGSQQLAPTYPAALLLPTKGRWHKKHKREKRKVLQMEFKKFRNFFIMLPCQIVKTGRKLVYRLLGWNEYFDVFFRAVTTFRHPLFGIVPTQSVLLFMYLRSDDTCSQNQAVGVLA